MAVVLVISFALGASRWQYLNDDTRVDRLTGGLWRHTCGPVYGNSAGAARLSEEMHRAYLTSGRVPVELIAQISRLQSGQECHWAHVR